MIAAVAVARGLAATSLRYFNVAGASGRFGEDHHPETHLIPLVLQAAAGTRDSVRIFGTNYPTRDGTAARGYIPAAEPGRAPLPPPGAAKVGEARAHTLAHRAR